MIKRFTISLTLLLLLSTYNIQENYKLSSILIIKKIIIENNDVVEKKKIKQKLSFLYGSNLFFIDTNQIKKQLKKIEFIKSYKIKKIYPETIVIKIFERKPVAIIQNKKNKKFFTISGQVIDYSNLKRFKDLPLVFGDERSFNNFYNKLIDINFPINEIKKFYLFKSNRWDMITKKNQTIKLPIKNFENSLKNFINLNKQVSFEKYKIFDYRIKDQLILN